MRAPAEEIERLYNIFSRYQPPAQLEGCPCCTSPIEGQRLTAKPLRELSEEELEHYAFKALTTWGTLDDYKYFLPRILELTTKGALLCDTEVTLSKLPYGDFREWPADERQVVGDFIFAVWREAVLAGDSERADQFLCGAAQVLDDVSPLLKFADEAAPDFKSAYAANHSNQTKRKLTNTFWERDTPNYQRVMKWLYPET